jgi:molybdenum cofactor biosynthesis enzyme MoaA
MSDYYCNQKFTWLLVDLEKRSMNCCCSATPERIDMEWVENNPGQLFNTPALKQERTDMLNGIPVASCAANCWEPESKGLASFRSTWNATARTHTDIESKPDTVDIVLGSQCNMACSYCSKQYSKTWRQDLISNGSYLPGHKRFEITQLDRIMDKISHADHRMSNGFSVLKKELTSFKNVTRYEITGGEPFLYNDLPDIVNGLDQSSSVYVFSGLGVNPTRFENQLRKMQHKNLTVLISAENTGQLYEFNRMGNHYDNFLHNLSLLKKYNITVHMNSVLGNVTLFGLADFIKTFADYKINMQFCTDPEFLQVNVLDDESKAYIINELGTLEFSLKDSLIESIKQPCTDEQRVMFSTYIKEFAKRKKLSLEIFPNSLQKWIE